MIIEDPRSKEDILFQNDVIDLHQLETDLQDIAVDLKLLDEKKKELMRLIAAKRQTIYQKLTETDTNKYICDAGTISLRPGRSKVNVKVSLEDIPEDYVKITKKPDLTAIKQELESGSGSLDHIAEITKSEPTLTVKLNSDYLDEIPF